MRRHHSFAVLLIASLVVAAAGCADRSGEKANVDGPASIISPGALLNARLSRTVTITGPHGATSLNRVLPDTDVQGIVGGNGVARAKNRLLLGVAGGTQVPDGRLTRSYTDAKGHRHTLVVVGPAGGGPAGEVDDLRDGVLLFQLKTQWVRRDGVWIRRASHLVAHRPDGHVVDLETLVGDVEPAAVPAARVDRPGLSPRFATTSTSDGCGDEWVTYLAASAVLDLAIDATVAAPSPVTAEAYLAAAAAWGVALDDLVNCLVTNG